MKILAIIVALLAIVGGIFFLTRNEDNTSTLTPSPSPVSPLPRPETTSPPPPAPQTQSEAVVTYTDSGYSPQNLTVKAGATVVFRNQSSNLMWTASAPHPTHTDLSEFDPLKGIAFGQTYAFTFTMTGTWRYHNHLNPTHFGSVAVE